MGSFANTVFSILLGWVQGLVSVIWSALTSENGNSFLKFLEKNWIIIAAVLCAAGIVIDFAVYMLRWQPYKVWRTFWQRRGHHGGNRDTAGEPEPEGVYFGNAAPAEQREKIPESTQRYEVEPDDLYRWREPEIPEPEPEYEYEESRPIVTKAGYVIPKDSPYRRPKDQNRRRRIRLLGDEDEADYRYVAPKPMMDQRDAYHEPVYPEKWTGNRERQS